MKTVKNKLSAEQSAALLTVLKTRFEKNINRHKGLDWAGVEARLKLPSSGEKRWSLQQMEETGGEPDVISFDKKTGEYHFYDCSPESPAGRRSICYDHEALEKRKENKPKDSAVQMAEDMGIELLTEEQYRYLQSCQPPGKNVDTKTSSWIVTPAAIRKLGGALFCDYRYNTIFLYHNGADSYYAARGFRGLLKI
jgi:hypothetical protein